MLCMNQVVTLMTLAAAALELGLASYCFCTAIDQARTWLSQPESEVRTRFAIDRYIWSDPVPAAARQRYLMSHIYACIGFVCLTALAFAHGPPTGGLFFAGISVLTIGQTWLNWRKYRRTW